MLGFLFLGDFSFIRINYGRSFCFFEVVMVFGIVVFDYLCGFERVFWFFWVFGVLFSREDGG